MQALVDFINEYSEGSKEMNVKQEIKGAENKHDAWEFNVERVANQEGLGRGIVSVSPNQEEVCYALKNEFQPTNNKVEYETLITGLKLTRAWGVQYLKVTSNSQLVTKHLNGTFQVKSKSVSNYLSKAQL